MVTETPTYTLAAIRERLPYDQYRTVDATTATARAQGFLMLNVRTGRNQEAAQKLAEAGYHVVAASLLTIPANKWKTEPTVKASYDVTLYVR